MQVSYNQGDIMDENKIFCTSCGSSNDLNSRFCYKCGFPLKTPSTFAPPVPSSDFITLSCPNCGGKLEITSSTDRFACKYCGHEHLVRHQGNEILLTPVVEGLKQVASKIDQAIVGSEKLAIEKTLSRFSDEINERQKQLYQKEENLRSILAHKTKLRHKMGWGIFVVILGFLIWFISTLDINNRDGTIFIRPICWEYPNVCRLMWFAYFVNAIGILILCIGILALFVNAGHRKEIRQPEIDHLNTEITRLKGEIAERNAKLSQTSQ